MGLTIMENSIKRMFFFDWKLPLQWCLFITVCHHCRYMPTYLNILHEHNRCVVLNYFNKNKSDVFWYLFFCHLLSTNVIPLTTCYLLVKPLTILMRLGENCNFLEKEGGAKVWLPCFMKWMRGPWGRIWILTEYSNNERKHFKH